jgi:hypothetical protein
MFWLLAALPMLSGCGDGIETTTVSGKATYQGQPLANGSVTFHPDVGHPTSVALDAHGAYSLELPSGNYRVTVNAAGVQVPAGWKEGDPEPPPPKLVLPPQYSTHARTELSITVAPNGEPQIADFDLK